MLPATGSTGSTGRHRQHPITATAGRARDGVAVGGVAQRTRPYRTLFVQILSSFTTEPLLGECQIRPFPA